MHSEEKGSIAVETRYTAVAIALHWLVALGFVIQLFLGWYIDELAEGSVRYFPITVHKNIGITIFLLVVFRILWRLTHKPPAFEFRIDWQRTLAALNHWALYLLLILQPISGYLSSSFSGHKTAYLGIPLLDWGSKNHTLNEFFYEAHEICATAIIFLVSLHIAAAIYHTVAEKRNFLSRMWFSRVALTNKDNKS